MQPNGNADPARAETELGKPSPTQPAPDAKAEGGTYSPPLSPPFVLSFFLPATLTRRSRSTSLSLAGPGSPTNGMTDTSDRYKKKAVLGVGASCKVLSVQEKATGKLFAMKVGTTLFVLLLHFTHLH